MDPIAQEAAGMFPQAENPMLSLMETISALPADQEADRETQARFLALLQEKQQSYSGYPTGWTPSIFLQFYEPPLRSRNAQRVLPEAKAYLRYFISRLSAQLAPCLALTHRLGPQFTYGEIRHMLQDMNTVEEALALANSLSGFGDIPQATGAVMEGLLQVHKAVEKTDFYMALQTRLCQAEICRIRQRYSHSLLPLLPTDIPALQQALDAFSAAYAALLAGETSAGIAQSVRIKILPILNELTAYAQAHFRGEEVHPKLLKTVDAVAEITAGIRRMTEAQRLETQRFQLDVNLELLSQLAKSMQTPMEKRPENRFK